MYLNFAMGGLAVMGLDWGGNVALEQTAGNREGGGSEREGGSVLAGQRRRRKGGGGKKKREGFFRILTARKPTGAFFVLPPRERHLADTSRARVARKAASSKNSPVISA